MPKFLPLFPLQLVVYPGEKLKLHIFEPRYKQLLSECRDDQATFGLPAYLEGKLAEYGTEMRLINIFKTYEDGEMDVLTEGVCAFHLEHFQRVVPEKMYSGGDVTILENDSEAYAVTTEELAYQYARFHELLRSGYTRDNFHAKNISFQIAHEVGLTIQQKVHMLSLQREAERQIMLIDHLHAIIPVLEGAEDTRKRIKANGHFKTLPPLEF
ncbi:MAG: LON peptidase substrate-binding domain-containing protein [Candidatus Hydrogenedentes bacterium]|nr:LON peptidase substrate-binding domain-containing protein [Candidatus Hydrogenedentota bacterium]